MKNENESTDGKKEEKNEIKIASRQLLEERAANKGTVIVIRNGVSQLVSARKILNELNEKDSKNINGDQPD